MNEWIVPPEFEPLLSKMFDVDRGGIEARWEGEAVPIVSLCLTPAVIEVRGRRCVAARFKDGRRTGRYIPVSVLLLARRLGMSNAEILRGWRITPGDLLSVWGSEL